MSNVERMKRRLLKQAVSENLEVIRGLGPASVRRSRRWGLPLVRTVVLLALPLGLLAPIYVIWGVARESFLPIPVAPDGRLEAVRETVLERRARALEKDTYGAPGVVARRVFPLSVKRVVLDPGHGGENSGTVTPQGLMEKELTLDIGRRLGTLLEEAAFEVAMTRDGDEGVSLEDRVAFANAHGGDIFVSIHLNWIEMQHVRGVETYYLGPTKDPYLNELASAENRDSGYSLADFRRLLEGVYVDVREDESRQLAEAVQDSLYRSLRKVNRHVQDRGIKTAPFVVLIGTEMPAILAEVSCLSNAEEADLLQKPLYRQYIADALFQGIHAYADSLRLPAPKGGG